MEDKDKCCPFCDEECEMVEVKSSQYGNPDDMEDVWVCKNRECDEYDEIVLTMGDLE